MSKIHIAVASIALSVSACGGLTNVPVENPLNSTAPEASAEVSKETLDSIPLEQKQALIQFYLELGKLEQDRRALQLDPQLTCTRYHESDRGAWPHINGYGVVSSGGTYRGAYQFLPSTWNGVAARHGRDDLVGVSPEKAAWYDQDAMANALRSERGMQPWGNRCR